MNPRPTAPLLARVLATVFRAAMFRAAMFRAAMFRAAMFRAAMLRAAMLRAAMLRAAMLPAAVFLAAMSLPAMLVACTYYVSRGSDLYSQGRYIEAAQVLEQTEARLADAAPDERAEYGLYRGATLLRLGDLDGALHWLEYAQSWEQRHPGALRAEERELLEERFIAVHADLERRAAAEGQVLQSRFR